MKLLSLFFPPVLIKISGSGRFCVYKFFSININVLLSKCFEVLQNRILDIMEIFVTKGSDTQSKALGVFFVLGALTTVSHDASTALPWLYDSFINNVQQ